MANFLFAVDPDRNRLETFLEHTEKDIAPVDGLEHKRYRGSNWGVVWAAGPKAPIDLFQFEEGISLLFGEAMNLEGKRETAESIHRIWQQKPEEVWDGYFANLVLSGTSLTVSCDVLGMYPIYYFQRKDTTLVASSPELISRHPLCDNKINPKGLIGILLTNGLVGGDTLLEGIHRLEPGCQLCLRNDTLTEVRVYSIPQSDNSYSLPLVGHGEILGDAMADAVRRHSSLGINYGMLLSGGLDSRMIAGLLVREGIKPMALTLGLESDLEVRCARAAASALRLTTINREPDPQHYTAYAKTQAKWEHLSNGFSQVRDWWTVRQIGALGNRLTSGILADAVVGGVAIGWAYKGSPPTMTFENFWDNMPQLRIPPSVLKELLIPEYRALVDETLSDLREEYNSYSDLESQKAWRYDLAHGQRFHVGITIWRLSFGAWPVVPVLDRKLLATAGGIPAVSMADRSAQMEIIKLYLPELIHIPLDRSDLVEGLPQYIEPRLRQRIKNHILGQTNKIKGKLPACFKKEQRYWYRVNDFEGEGWQAARLEAEPQRELLGQLFNLDVLAQLLPAPGSTEKNTKLLIQPGAKKLLLGLMHWAKDHL